MKTYLDCIPCFFRQALQAARLAGADEEIQRRILIELGRELERIPLEASPPEMGERIYSLIKKYCGPDPFKEAKEKSNEYVLSLYPALRKKVHGSDDPLRFAVRLAISGNVIDYAGARRYDLKKELDQALESGFGVFQYDEFRNELKRAKRVLYLADNAGEIVFDRILIERIKEEYSSEIIVAVRGAPVINDATIDDARRIGLDKICRVISNGSAAPGTLLDRCSKQFLEIYRKADLVISKGQGNFESLWGEKKNIFFLFKVKCPVVAEHTGCREGDSVLLKNSSTRFEQGPLRSS